MAEPSAEFWEDAHVPGMAEDVAERIAKSPYAIREGETFEEYDARCKAAALNAKRANRK